MYKIGIIGATGYTGSELVRLLYTHPQVEIVTITSESHQGKSFSDIHPQFTGLVDITLEPAEVVESKNPDLIFLALPHGVSMDFVKRLANTDAKIIDLSGDFRLSSKEVYEEWYQQPHTYPQGFDDAVFGLPELYRDSIREARLVANPGCFPTGAILATAPLLKEAMIDPARIFIDSKTGVTGAGIKAKAVTHFPNVNDNFKAYGIKKHRHTIEIQETVSHFSGKNATVQFTPHLLPVDRGILTSAYSIPVKETSATEIRNIFEKYYRNEPFIRLRSESPELKNVRGTNLADIYPAYDERTGNIMVFSAIDNLVKGAAGQAIQNMNIMLGIEEAEGLNLIPLQP
jgi:N-acetyl-gamma-glutamyl-phosphate reductase